MNIDLGQLVYSKAGRDKGNPFIIVDIADEQYILVSDGDLRKIEKPKRKKIKHLEFTETVISTLNEKLVNKQKITNAEIRKSLGAVNSNRETG